MGRWSHPGTEWTSRQSLRRWEAVLRGVAFVFLLTTTAYLNAQPPNIVLLVTDDQRWDTVGYAGNTVIQTPNLDSLAREGTYFRNAFVTTSICAASRASIFTGLY